MAMNDLYIGVIAAVALCGLSTMNLISAPSISLEGRVCGFRNPCPYQEMLLAKAKRRWLSLFLQCITQIIVRLLRFRLTTISCCLLCRWCLRCLQHFRALYQPDVPKTDWVSETVAVKQSASILHHAWFNCDVVIPIVLYVFVLDKHMDIYSPAVYCHI